MKRILRSDCARFDPARKTPVIDATRSVIFAGYYPGPLFWSLCWSRLRFFFSKRNLMANIQPS